MQDLFVFHFPPTQSVTLIVILLIFGGAFLLLGLDWYFSHGITILNFLPWRTSLTSFKTYRHGMLTEEEIKKLNNREYAYYISSTKTKIYGSLFVLLAIAFFAAIFT